jgi:hypothetical protein
MERCTVVLKLVLEMNDDRVAPVGFDVRTGHLAVDEKTHALDAVGCNGGVRNLKGVLNGAASLGRDLIAVVVDRVSAEVIGVISGLAIAGDAEVGLLGLRCASTCGAGFVLDSSAWDRVIAGARNS